MKRNHAFVVLFFLAGALSAQEISVQMKIAYREFILGEPVSVQFSLLNVARSPIVCGGENGGDRLLLEVTRGTGRDDYLSAFNSEPVGGSFTVEPGKQIQRTIELDKWFPLLAEGKYLVRAVLVHSGMRYESQKKSFDVVPGIKLQDGIQMFVNRKNLRRTLRLVYWSRNQSEHLFLRVFDEPGNKIWDSIDLGILLRTDPARMDISPEGVITIVQRATQDAFLRTVLWSLPDSLEIAEQNHLIDPNISASQRAKSLYNEMAEDKAEKEKNKKSWWKIW